MWSARGWTAQSTLNYTGAYRDPGSVPTRRVDSWTTVDINIGHRVDGGSGWLANTRFNLGINNALDQRPAFVNQFDLPSGTLGYDRANASLLGGQVSLHVVKQGGGELASSQPDDSLRRPRPRYQTSFLSLHETGTLLHSGFMHAPVL